MLEPRYLVRCANSLTDAERRALGALIFGGFPLALRYCGAEQCERWRTLAWRTTPALAHCVAYVGGEPVAQQSLFSLKVTSGLRVFGLGDMVVAQSWRGRGLARTLIGMALSMAHAQDAQAICTCTTKLVSTFQAHGFEHDADGLRFCSERGEPLEHLWVWLADGVEPSAERLYPSDF